MHVLRFAGVALVCAAAVGTAAADKQAKAAKAALKQVTEATTGIRGIVAEVEFAQVIDRTPIDGEGKRLG